MFDLLKLMTGFGFLCIFVEMVSRGGEDAPSVIKLDTVKKIAEQVNVVINLFFFFLYFALFFFLFLVLIFL